MPVPKRKSRLLSSLGEFGLINLLARNLPVSGEVIAGIGDDTAVVKYTARKHMLFTTDMIAEDVHFKRGDSPVLIGQKAMSCNISDVAAMGGVPKFAVISIGLPKGLSVEYVQKIYQGLEKRAREFGVVIVGGDTIKSDKIIINVALTGEVEKKSLVTRSGAKKGDWIFVTGPLGKSFGSTHHLSFRPRLKESRYLVKHVQPNAMIDISDGLAPDLGHILKASQVGARLKEGKIPRRHQASLKEALYDGEDFELLFTLSPKKADKLLRTRTPFSFYHVGEITEQKGKIILLDRNLQVREIHSKGFEHF